MKISKKGRQKSWQENRFRYSLVVIIITIFAGILTEIFSGIFTKILHPEMYDSNLEVISYSFIENKLTPIIEFKLKNKGNNIAYIHSMKIEVYKSRDLIPYYQPSHQDMTRNYEIEIPNKKAPFTATFDLSQSIKEHNVDNFSIAMNFNETGIEYKAYYMKIILIYDKDNKLLETDNLIVLMRPNIMLQGAYYTPKDYVLDIIKHNEKALNEINNLYGIRNNLWDIYISEFQYNDLNSDKIFVADNVLQQLNKPIFKDSNYRIDKYLLNESGLIIDNLSNQSKSEQKCYNISLIE